jgi:hypothetical protein
MAPTGGARGALGEGEEVVEEEGGRQGLRRMMKRTLELMTGSRLAVRPTARGRGLRGDDTGSGTSEKIASPDAPQRRIGASTTYAAMPQ